MHGSEEKKKRTKQQLTNALILLCEEKNYYDITISDICTCAGVNRSTFYHYYNSKDDLLRKIEQEYVQYLRDLTPSLNLFYATAPSALQENFKTDLISVLNFHQKNKALTRFLLSPNGDPYFMRHIETSLQNAMLENLRQNHVQINTFEKYYVHFFAYGYVNTVWKWLKEQDCTIEEMADYLIQCMTNIPYQKI